MEQNTKRAALEEYLDRARDDWRYSISAYRGDTYIGDVLASEAADVAQVCLCALQKHFGKRHPGTRFVLDDSKQAHTLHEMLEAADGDDA